MAGIMAALKADDDVSLLGQPVDDLALAFVSPLGADDDDVCHAEMSPAGPIDTKMTGWMNLLQAMAGRSGYLMTPPDARKSESRPPSEVPPIHWSPNGLAGSLTPRSR